MKRITTYTLAAILFLAIGCTRKSPESQVIFEPEKPTLGDSLKVAYFPGENSPLADADSVLMQAQLYPSLFSGEIRLVEVPMLKQGGKWVAGIRLDENDVGCMLFQFASGDSIDSNQGQAWDLLVHTPEGKPIQGAYVALSRTYTSSFYMKRNPNRDQALEYINQELELYPDNWLALSASWGIRNRKFKDDSIQLTKIHAEVDSLVRIYPDNVALLKSAYHYYNRMDDTKRAKQLVKRIKELDPEDTTPFWAEWSEICDITDGGQRIKAALLFYRKIKDSQLRETTGRSLVSWMIGEKKWRKAVTFVDTMPDPKPNVLNQLAWELVEQNRMLTQAASLAERAVQMLRNPDESHRPPYMPKRQWLKSQITSLGNILDTYAFALYKLGKLQKAEQAFQESHELTNGSNAEITARYLQCLVDNDKLDQVLILANKAVEENKANEQINDLLRQAYKQKTGSSAPADSLIAQAKKKAAETLKEEVAKRIIKNPELAPSFTLATLDGDSISLESLHGKVVIVDFWATWCGPCKSSFPYLQKFWDEHKQDPDVTVLAINCWERKKGDERVDLVRSFITKNDYTMPVLLDMKDEFVAKYGVKGIPTKFLVGPDGKIYFKDVGFSGPQMVDEMNLELEMLRKKLPST